MPLRQIGGGDKSGLQIYLNYFPSRKISSILDISIFPSGERFFNMRNLIQRKSLIGLLIVIVVLVGIYAVFFAQKTAVIQEQSPSVSIAPPKENLISASLVVDDNTYEVSLPQGSSAYDLVRIAADQTDFSFKGKEFKGVGFFVEEIMGIAGDTKENKYWIYYINGEKAKVGVSDYTVQPEDTITWKYEKSDF